MAGARQVARRGGISAFKRRCRETNNTNNNVAATDDVDDPASSQIVPQQQELPQSFTVELDDEPAVADEIVSQGVENIPVVSENTQLNLDDGGEPSKKNKRRTQEDIVASEEAVKDNSTAENAQMENEGVSQRKKRRTHEIITVPEEVVKTYQFEKVRKVPKLAIESCRKYGSFVYDVDDECKDMKYCIETIYHPEVSTVENVYVRVCITFPPSKTIQADFTINVPSSGYSKDVSQLYHKTGFFNVPCFNHQAICDPNSSYFNEEGWMEIIIKGSFKVQPIEKKPILLIDLTKSGGNGEKDEDVWFVPKSEMLIIVGDRTIHAHKSTIQSKFTKLDTVCNHLEKNELQIENFPFNVVNAAVAYCYEEPIPDDLTNEELIQLMKFADHYGIEFLKFEAELNVARKMDDSNCVDIANASINYNVPELKQRSIDYLNEAKFAKKDNISFQDLDKSIFEEVFLLNP